MSDGGCLPALLAIACLLASCGPPPPELEQARADFERAYPGVTVASIRIREDEVVARNFDVRYRHAGTGAEGSTLLQYVQQDDGSWKISPALPASLP